MSTHRPSFLFRFAMLAVTLAGAAVVGGCTIRGAYHLRSAPVIDDSQPAEATPAPVATPEAVEPAAPGEPNKVVIEAGPIWSNTDAQTKCPTTCGSLDWEGVWWTTVWNEMSVCECLDRS